MTTTTPVKTEVSSQELYDQAEAAAKAALQDADAPADDGYGCGGSFVTIRWGTEFMRWARKNGLAKKDSYYGWILDTNKNANASGTLAQEHYNTAFAKSLSDNGVHAFNHTYLT